MPTYVVEREISGVGGGSAEQTRKTAEKSWAVLREMRPETQWVTSCVTGDRRYCVYIAPPPRWWQNTARRGTLRATGSPRCGP
jgi:Protein of unknown function (DUF4242)